MEFSDKEIEKWCKLYDELRHPPSVYNELVLNKVNHKNKYEIIGAWKTGCLNKNNETDHPIYTDARLNIYELTSRWKHNAGVHYNAWINIADKINYYQENLSKSRTEYQPEIFEEIIAFECFGYISAIFILHCIYPNTYPLYDNNTYCAYKYIQSDKSLIQDNAPHNWFEFNRYSNFFESISAKSKFDISVIYRALWAYGKYIKTINLYRFSDPEDFDTRPMLEIISDSGWSYLTTLKNNPKYFWWKLDPEDFSLIFINSPVNKKELYIHQFEIEEINSFLNKNRVDLLSSNYKKLVSGAEDFGLGLFCYNELGWKDPEKINLIDKMIAIFVKAEIWHIQQKRLWSKSCYWDDEIVYFYRTSIPDN
jgi:hypothetical protein